MADIVKNQIRFPYWIISHGVENVWYVSRSPQILFTENLEEAKHLTKAEALEAFGILADMQRLGSSSKPESYVLTCVKE